MRHNKNQHGASKLYLSMCGDNHEIVFLVKLEHLFPELIEGELQTGRVEAELTCARNQKYFPLITGIGFSMDVLNIQIDSQWSVTLA